MGAEPRRTGPRLPLDRDGRRTRPARRRPGGADLGQLTLAAFVRDAVDDHAVDPDRRRRHLDGPASLGQRGPDDPVLPRHRPRGQARARPRRAARAAPPRDPRVRRARGIHAPDRHLSRLQRRPGRRARLGRGDVDRHRVRTWSAGAADPALGHPRARVLADAVGGRRPGRAGRDRDRLHPPRLGGRAGGGDRAVRGPARASLRAVRSQRALGRGRGRGVGGDAEVGHRSGRLRPGDRARHERLPALARGARAGHRADTLVPRAADAGARPLRPAEPAVGDLPQ